MPVDLHQQLSEFSYGYGVTREFEASMRASGLRPTPFLPSLLQEAQVAFDVAFDRPGKPLLVQFKLGEALQRFRRTDMSKPAPALSKPFWRFGIETAEANGQFDLLLKAENEDAEVYYVAPRFANWERYVELYQGQRVLQNSLLITPREIDTRLAAQGAPDGWHKVVYDQANVFVFSEPTQLEEVDAAHVGSRMRTNILTQKEPVAMSISRAFQAIGRRREIRKPSRGRQEGDTFVLRASTQGELDISPSRLARERKARTESVFARARSAADAEFAIFGLEAWAIGAQLIAVTIEE